MFEFICLFLGLFFIYEFVCIRWNGQILNLKDILKNFMSKVKNKIK